MRIETHQVQTYLNGVRKQFSASHLPDASPVKAAIAAATKNSDILGLEALAKACAEAHEMAVLRNQRGVADIFEQHRRDALDARLALL